jgi:hypothetical protein
VKNLLLTGGPYHPFRQSSRTLAGLLDAACIDSVITDDAEAALTSVGEFDLITMYLLRWRMLGEQFDDDRGQWAGSLSEKARAALLDHLGRGRPLFALHTAAVSFDD